jgi:UDP-2-acetamido-2-deoxy-ribo-hexuluronate aminotransferase
MEPIKMVDLHTQYLKIKSDIDNAIQEVLNETAFIQGRQVKAFEKALAEYTGARHVISCGNGTDALQIALMALDAEPGDEVILPVFTYVATAEVIALLRLTPVFVDVDPHTFNIDVQQAVAKITDRTKAIVPVHLFGQCADVEPLVTIARQRGIAIIEDAAQALGAQYRFTEGTLRHAGTIGQIGCTSFFPSKNLACFGDGGAMFTNDDALAERLRMTANHGQKVKYYHDLIGVNSRLDTLQAAILNVKLAHLDTYTTARQRAAQRYDEGLGDLKGLTLPFRAKNSTHVFNQYTVQVADSRRDALRAYLQEKGVPTMVYYPVPLHFQKAYKTPEYGAGAFPVAERLSESVLSLPVHTEMTTDQLDYICDVVRSFFRSH